MKYTRTQAMRLFCLECMGFSDHRGMNGATRAEALAEVKKCTDKKCPLYPYRTKGSLPNEFKSKGLQKAGRKRAEKGLFGKQMIKGVQKKGR